MRRRETSILIDVLSLLLSPFERRGMTRAKATEFYKSREWKELRYAALKKYGARCMCCGTTPGYGARIVVDHIKPVRTHGHLRLAISNLQILCNTCNRGKGSRCSKDWRPRP